MPKFFFFLLVLSIIIFATCSNDKSTRTNGFATPIKPSEGNIWPPQTLRKAFLLGELDQPSGIQDPSYASLAGKMTYPTYTLYEDYLDINFEEANTLAVAIIDDQLQKSGYSLNTDFYLADYYTSGWKSEKNIVYWVESEIYGSAGGFLNMTRLKSDILYSGWPKTADLAIFALEDWVKPDGIENQYYFLHKSQETRLFSRFTGATSLTNLLFENYFSAKAMEFSDGWNNYYRLIIGNTVYLYEYYVDEDSGYGYFECRRYTTDNPPGQGHSWPPAERLEPFTLGDWTMPLEITGLSWLSDLYADQLRMTINFTGATELSAEMIETYLSAQASGSFYHSSSVFHGYFQKSDAQYNYYFEYFFTASAGGYIELTRKNYVLLGKNDPLNHKKRIHPEY